MTAFDAMLQMWFMHALLAAALSAPVILFGRKRAKWQAWELTTFVLPYTIWAVLSDTGKSLANLGECFAISLAIPVAALVRVLLGQRQRPWIVSSILLVFLCCVAVGVWKLTPPLPEVPE